MTKNKDYGIQFFRGKSCYILLFIILLVEEVNMMKMDWKMINGQILMIKFVSNWIDKFIVCTIMLFMLENMQMELKKEIGLLLKMGILCKN